jgi:hypothetical protein
LEKQTEGSNLHRRWAQIECGDPESNVAGRSVCEAWSLGRLDSYRSRWRYPNSVLAHVTDTAIVHVSEPLVPNDAKGLTGQVVDLLSYIFIWVVEGGDWRSRIDSRRRRLWVDSWEITWAACGAAGTRRWRPGWRSGSGSWFNRSNNGFRSMAGPGSLASTRVGRMRGSP